MAVQSNVAEAWQEWLRTTRPVSNFLSNNVRSLTYGIECDLEHQAAYLVTMVEALRDKNQHWDFVMRANHELRDLEQFVDRLQSLELGGEVEAPYHIYAGAVKRLLNAVKDSVASAQRPGP